MWSNPRGNGGLDPYTLSAAAAPNDNREVNGLKRVSPLLIGGQRTLNLVTFGDSLATNVLTQDAVPSFYTPTNITAGAAKQLQMGNLWDGAIYMAEECLVGCGPSRLQFAGQGYTASVHPLTQACDEILTADLADRIIIWSIAVGGSTAGDWAVGGTLNHRLVVTGKRIQALGLDAASVMLHGCVGTNDAGLDYVDGGSVRSSAFQTKWQSVIDTWRGTDGSGLAFTGPILMDRATWVYYPPHGDTVGALAPTTSTIVTALGNLVAGNAGVYHGRNLNAYNNTYRVDFVHPNYSLGLAAWSTSGKTEIIAHL